MYFYNKLSIVLYCNVKYTCKSVSKAGSSNMESNRVLKDVSCRRFLHVLVGVDALDTRIKLSERAMGPATEEAKSMK